MRESDESVLKEKIKTGDISGLFVFYGEEDYLKEYYLKEMRKSLLGGGENMSYIAFEQEGFSTEQFFGEVNTYPFFSEKKIIVIRNLALSKLKENDKKAFLDILSELPEFAVVVLYYDKMYTDADYFTKQKRESEIKSIGKKGTIVQFALRGQNELLRWVLRHFAAEKVPIDNDTASFFLFYTDCDMASLKTEIEKLVNRSNGKKITKDDIIAITTKSNDAEMFDLSNAVAEKNFDKIFDILGKLKTQNFTPYEVLSAMSTVLTEMLYAKAAAESGVSSDRLVTDFAINPKRKFLFDKYFRFVMPLPLEYFIQTVRAAENADIKLKSSKVDGWQIIENTLFQIAESRFLRK